MLRLCLNYKSIVLVLFTLASSNGHFFGEYLEEMDFSKFLQL